MKTLAAILILAATMWHNRIERTMPVRHSVKTPETEWMFTTHSSSVFRDTLHDKGSVTLAPTGAVKSEHWTSTLDASATPVKFKLRRH